MKSCLFCKNKSFKVFYNLKSFPIYFGAIPKKDNYKINKFPLEVSYCKKCNLVQQTKRVKESVLNQVYSSKYYNCPSPKKSGMGKREIHKFWNFFKSIKQKKGKSLEIASFDGYLMGLMKNIGWDVYGCDPANESKNAQRKFGKKIKTVFYKAGVYKKKEFDLIIFRNLFEHIYDYKKFLNNVSYSLKDGGHIFIDVPNIKENIKAGSFGVFFHQHISYFSKNTITSILNNYGFKVLKIFDGNPNLFIYAKKNSIRNKLIKKNKDNIFLKKNIKKSDFTKKKIIKIFQNEKNKRIVLFGMSALATSIVNLLPQNLKKKIILLSDNDIAKHDKLLCGFNMKISHPSKLLFLKYDKLLICSYFFKKEIVNSLKNFIKDPKKIVLI